MDKETDAIKKSTAVLKGDHGRVSRSVGVTLEPAEVAFNLLLALNFLDAVDGSGLAVAKELGRVASLELGLSLTSSSHNGARWAEVRKVMPRTYRYKLNL